MSAPTYDETYLTDPGKVRRFAAWIMISSNFLAQDARKKMGLGQKPRMSEETYGIVFRYLFAPDTDPTALIGAFRGSQGIQSRTQRPPK